MRKKWLLDGAAVFIITLVSGFCMWSLTKPGLPAVHDANPHIARMIAFHQALSDGQFPPMWAKEVLGGIGSPVMMLNYQLPYFVSEAWVRLGLSYFDSYKFTMALAFLLSGLTMYAALRQKYKVLPALLGALVYLLAPYRMVDVYVRGAFGETLSFIFPPLILLGYYRKSTRWLTLGWAGLFLTHPLASAAFTAFFLGYSLIVTEGREKLAVLKRHGVAFILAFAIAAFNLLPTLALTKFTYYTPADSGPLTQFPTLSQLFYSPWGYGISIPGPHDTMSFELGTIQWIVIFSATLYWFYLRLKQHKKSPELGYIVATTWICIFFILDWSTPLYREFHLTSIIDLPWRLLLCPVFASAVLTPILLSKLQEVWVYTLAGIGTIVMGILIIPMVQTPPRYWHKPLSFFAYETGDSYGEYAPKWRATRDSSPFWLRAEPIAGIASIKTEANRSNWQDYLVVTNNGAVVRINTSYFPGWTVLIDQKNVEIDTRQNAESKNSPCYVTTRILAHIDDSGLIACHVTPGEHDLTIKYVMPSVQRLGLLVSLFGIGGYLWLLSRSFYLRLTSAKR